MSKIRLHNFMKHDNTEVSLPDKGLVVVQGHTGSGKSSLVEAVGYAYNGELLRETSPWRDNVAGWVEVEADGTKANRAASPKGKVTLRWEANGDSDKGYATPTKAQEGLTSHIGVNFDTWSRCCVFSSRLMKSFAGSTDADRKAFIENMLGAHKFNVALKFAKAEHDEARRRLDTLQRDVTMMEMRRDTLRSALNSEVASPTVPYSEAEHADVLRVAKSMASEAADTAECVRLAVTNTATAAAAVSQLKLRIAGLNKRVCDACKQSIPLADRETLLDEATRSLAEAVLHWELCVSDMEGLTTVSREQAGDVAKLQATARYLEGVKAAYAAKTDEARRRAATREDLTQTETHLQNLYTEREALAYDDAVKGYVVDGLGLRGVRARMMSGVLTSLENQTNAWLAKLAPGTGIRVRIKPFTERKSGVVVEKISIEVLGLGHSQGYKGDSSGENRLVDLAMLLSLSVMASAAHGMTAPTLWFDEPFDTLDPELVERLADCLADMAHHQCVVVITHNDALKHMACALRVNVANGKIV